MLWLLSQESACTLPEHQGKGTAMFNMPVRLALCAALVLSASVSVSARNQELVIYPLDQWPDQDIVDTRSLERHFAEASSFATQGIPRPRDLGKCRLDNDLAWQMILPTDQHVTERIRYGAPGIRQEIKRGKIVVYSTDAGCAALPGHINRDVIAPQRIQSLALSVQFRFPLYIESDYRYLHWMDKYTPIPFRERYTIDRVLTGHADYPVADRIVSRATMKGSPSSDVPHHVMNFHGSGAKPGTFVSLQRGQTGLLVANGLYIVQQAGSDTYAYEWYPSGRVLPLRNNRLHGAVKRVPWNAGEDYVPSEPLSYDCFYDHERVEYFRLVGSHGCVAVEASEAGKPGVYRDRIAVLIEQQAREAMEASALASAAVQQAAGAGAQSAATTDGEAKEGVGEACAKAYAAHRLCQTMPSDPFGVSRRFCVSQVKKNFGGSGCPLPF